MNQVLFSSMVAIMIPIIVFLISWFTATRSPYDREKSSPFECGFDPNHSARIPFSLRFFLLAIIFIVFDIEIVLLIPTPLLLDSHDTNTSVHVAAIIFLIILVAGLYHEWTEGSLSWSS